MSLPSLARIPAPPDPILGLAEAFRNDTREGRINLSSGVFVDETGKTPVLPTVIEAERRLAAAAGTKLYRPIDGEVAYRELVRALALGRGHEAVTSGRALATQTPGGTGGLRVAADLLRQTGVGETLWMSDPTWPNHPQLFAAAGFRVRTYPYTDPTGRRIDEDAMLDALRGAPARATSSCSTARATTRPAWTRPRPCGGGSATSSRSGACCRSWTSPTRASATDSTRTPRACASWCGPGAELLVSTSFSKTFSLYAERVGALIVIAGSAADAAAIQSHVKIAIRVNYSNPPAHGADIVRTILADEELRAQWEVELAGMRDRINDNRVALVAALEARGIPGDWSAIATPARHVRAARPDDRSRSRGSRTSTASTSWARAGSTSRASRPPTSDPFADALAAVLATS